MSRLPVFVAGLPRGWQDALVGRGGGGCKTSERMYCQTPTACYGGAALSSYPATMSAIPRDAGPTLNRHGVNSRVGKFARVGYTTAKPLPPGAKCARFLPLRVGSIVICLVPATHQGMIW